MLTYGRHSNDAISAFTQSISVGNSRFDDFFSNPSALTQVSIIKAALDKNKKTILYLPTYGDLCSMDFAAPGITRILNAYNIIIHPHPIAENRQEAQLTRFKETISKSDLRKKVMWTDDTTDLVALLSVSDLVITDSGGAIFDALLADKPILLLDFMDEKYLQNNIEKYLEDASHKKSRPLVGPKDFAERFKHEKDLQIGEILKDIRDLPSAVERGLANRAQYEPQRAKVKEMVFAYSDGTSGRRAAEAIQSLSGKINEEKTFLALQTDIEVEDQTRSYRVRSETMLKSASKYINLSTVSEPQAATLVDFSIVLTLNSRLNLDDVLLRVLDQDGIPRTDYEIIIIDDGTTSNAQDNVRSCAKKYPDALIVYIEYKKKHRISLSRNIGILHARGRYVVFLDDDIPLSKNWLTTFHRAFRENPEIAGVSATWDPVTENKEWRDQINGFDPAMRGQKINPHTFPRGIKPHGKDLKPPFIPVARPQGILEGVGIKASLKLLVPKGIRGAGIMCFRKNILIEIGGCNPYFTSTEAENYELKIRAQKAWYAVLEITHSSSRRKGEGFGGFTKRMLRYGYDIFLFSLIHPDIDGPRPSAVLYSSFPILFVSLGFLVNLYLWIGKYWISLTFLDAHNRES
jgi:glycosyltransferase involved in cell wall biosynthesis